MCGHMDIEKMRWGTDH